MNLSQYIDSLKDKRITVLGIGVSNTPLIKLLCAGGCTVEARDRRDRQALGDTVAQLEEAGAKLVLGDNYLDDINADIIFRTPGLRPDMPGIVKAVQGGAVLTSEMEAFFEVCPCKIIAVTGSDGKTTTTSVIAKLLEMQGYNVYTGGNIGTPLLDKAGQMTDSDIVVLELSSFQLMTMNCSPDIAVVTNVAPNHLDVHRDMQEYIDAKKNVFVHQNKSGRVVLNADNDITSSFVKDAKGEYFMFSRRREVYNGVFCQDGIIYEAVNGTDTEIMKAGDIFLPGVHNVENYMAAFAAVRGLVSHETMRAAAMEFKGVEHRIEFVRELRGVKYYNDSIASSPSRTTAGLRSFNQKVILIAGGKDKGVPFDSLGAEIVQHVKKLVLTGLTADKIRAAVENCPEYRAEPEIITCEGFREAVETASALAQPGDVVILSPACTSFDRFKNFEERGNTFKTIVNELK